MIIYVMQNITLNNGRWEMGDGRWEMGDVLYMLLIDVWLFIAKLAIVDV
jgi:hypothetical protein